MSTPTTPQTATQRYLATFPNGHRLEAIQMEVQATNVDRLPQGIMAIYRSMGYQLPGYGLTPPSSIKELEDRAANDLPDPSKCSKESNLQKTLQSIVRAWGSCGDGSMLVLGAILTCPEEDPVYQFLGLADEAEVIPTQHVVWIHLSAGEASAGDDPPSFSAVKPRRHAGLGLPLPLQEDGLSAPEDDQALTLFQPPGLLVQETHESSQSMFRRFQSGRGVPLPITATENHLSIGSLTVHMAVGHQTPASSMQAGNPGVMDPGRGQAEHNEPYLRASNSSRDSNIRGNRQEPAFAALAQIASLVEQCSILLCYGIQVSIRVLKTLLRSGFVIPIAVLCYQVVSLSHEIRTACLGDHLLWCPVTAMQILKGRLDWAFAGVISHDRITADHASMSLSVAPARLAAPTRPSSIPTAEPRVGAAFERGEVVANALIVVHDELPEFLVDTVQQSEGSEKALADGASSVRTIEKELAEAAVTWAENIRDELDSLNRLENQLSLWRRRYPWCLASSFENYDGDGDDDQEGEAGRQLQRDRFHKYRSSGTHWARLWTYVGIGKGLTQAEQRAMAAKELMQLASRMKNTTSTALEHRITVMEAIKTSPRTLNRIRNMIDRIILRMQTEACLLRSNAENGARSEAKALAVGASWPQSWFSQQQVTPGPADDAELQHTAEEVEGYSATLTVISRLIKDENSAKQDRSNSLAAEIQLLQSWGHDLQRIVSSLDDAAYQADPKAIGDLYTSLDRIQKAYKDHLLTQYWAVSERKDEEDDWAMM